MMQRSVVFIARVKLLPALTTLQTVLTSISCLFTRPSHCTEKRLLSVQNYNLINFVLNFMLEIWACM